MTVIRSLAADELPWFVGRALAFIGHSDPQRLALLLAPRFRDPRGDAQGCRVLARPGRSPSAGVHVQAPDPDDDSRRLLLSSPWHDDDVDGFAELVAEVLRRHEHDAAVLRLDAVPPARRDELAARLAPLGFAPDEVARMRFDLSQVPPLGSPLLLEAWSEASDRRFRAFYEDAEGRPVTDAGWAYLKRKNGPFQPDLWFLARETLDQDPVGYAFCGLVARRVDGQYTLDAVGVARELRSDSAALRRLVISTLNELASFSPVGAVDAEVSRADGRLGDILRYVGFVPVVRSPVLVKRPE